MYITFISSLGINVGTAQSQELIDCKSDSIHKLTVEFDSRGLRPDVYIMNPDLYCLNNEGNHYSLDRIFDNIVFKIVDDDLQEKKSLTWKNCDHGNVELETICLVNDIEVV